MNVAGRFFVLIGFLLLACMPASASELPATLAYDGTLPEKVGDGPQDLTFSLYTSRTGGLPVWTEIRLGVPVRHHRFHVVLGKNNPLNELDAGRDYYLAIQSGLKMDAPELGTRQLVFRAEVPKQPAPPAAPAAPAEPVAAAPSVSLPVVPVAAGADNHDKAVASLRQVLDRHVRDKTVHFRQGKGSHLDADLLDGRDSASFADRQALDAHLHNRKNPHAVTAAMVDAYSRAEVAAMIDGLRKQIAELQAKLKYVSVSGTEMHISGANLHIENGTGSTDGKQNGLGNLIIGYNAVRPSDNQRSGSHNLIVGDRQNYVSYGGIAAGFSNTLAAPYASVTGGRENTVTGRYSSITGGRNNTTKGENSTVSGGIKNITIGEDDWAAGGLFQTE